MGNQEQVHAKLKAWNRLRVTQPIEVDQRLVHADVIFFAL